MHSRHEKRSRLARFAAHGLIRAYQLSLSSILGRQCRHLPTCSAYMDEAITRHGVWPGGWMGLARLCRCHPWGTAGFDPVPSALPDRADWAHPWRYGHWCGPLVSEPCCAEAVPPSNSLGHE
jgi:uncharacterized protein